MVTQRRLVDGHLPEAVAHAAMEVVAFLLEAIELPSAHAPLEHLWSGIEQQHQVRPVGAHRPLVEAPHFGQRQFAPVALVGERGVHAAVAHHVAAADERGRNDLVDVLRGRLQ